MTSVLVPPDLDGIDGAGLFRITNFQPVVDAGYSWVSLYEGGAFGVSRRTIEACWDVGLPVMLNHERSPSAGLSGYSGGVAAAKEGMRIAADLGFLGEAPFVFSGVDFSPRSAAELQLCLDWARGTVDVLQPAEWLGGQYGPKTFLEKLTLQDWWPEDYSAWHWGGDGFVQYTWANAKQWYGRNPHYQPPHDNRFIGAGVDENTTLWTPMKMWSGYGPDKLDPDNIPDPQQQGVGGMASHIAWVDVIRDATPTTPEVWIYFGEIVQNAQGILCRTGTENDAVGVFGLPRVRSYQSAYEALPIWSPEDDARWLASFVTVPPPPAPVLDLDAIAVAVRAKFTSNPLK